MRNKLEKALLIYGMNADIKDVDRVYFGNEFCQNLIPSLQILKETYLFTKSKNKEFTLITPYVTNAGLRKLEPLLNFLNGQHGIEVVFNDWGVLKLIKDSFKNLKPVLGRLLTKQRRDPQMSRIFQNKDKIKHILNADKTTTVLYRKEPPHSLFEHYQASMINLPVLQEYLLSQGIYRLEIDNLAWEMNIDVTEKMGISIYLPYGYISTTRMCGKLTLTYAACKKECQKYFMRLEDKSLPVPLYSIGNAVFYETPPPSLDCLEKSGIDRIVYQSRLPY